MVNVLLGAGLLLSILFGALRGFLHAAFSLLGWVLAFLTARWWGSDASQILKSWGPFKNLSDTVGLVLGSVVVFIVVAFVSGWLASLLKTWAKSHGMASVDRSLGALFGLIRGLILIMGLVMLVNLSPWAEHEEWQSSQVVQWSSQMAVWLKNVWDQNI